MKSEYSREREHPRGRPVVGLIALGLGILLLAAVVVPFLLRARIASNETAAIGTLRTLSTSQAQFQSQGIVDQDGDGIGEFGWLAELSGAQAPRGQDQSLAPNQRFIPDDRKPADDGIAERKGYCFLLYLPMASGHARRDPGAALAPDPGAADMQEERFVSYAWPSNLGKSGNRVFVVSQDGEIFTSGNRDTQNYAGRVAVPSPGAALVSDSKATNPVRGDAIGPVLDPRANLQGQFICGEEDTGDGFVWLPAGC